MVMGKRSELITTNNRDIKISWLFVWARHKTTLSVHQMRLILRILEFCQDEIKGIKYKDNLRQLEYSDDDVVLRMPVTDVYFSDFSLETIREDLKNLRERSIEFYDHLNGVWRACGIIEKPRVYERTGMMEVKIDLQFWRQLLNLSHGIKRCELNKALNLPTVYSMWFYIFISERNNPIDIRIDHLKEKLGISADDYKRKNGKDRIDHLEERVLLPAQKALNESCPYSFKYEKIRENPRSQRSPVKLLRFSPVYQPQYRDPNLEKKTLLAKTSVSQINQQAVDYMIHTMGFELKEVQSNKELLEEATKLLPNILEDLRDIQNRRRLKGKEKGWIINALKGKIQDIKEDSSELHTETFSNRDSGYIANLYDINR